MQISRYGTYSTAEAINAGLDLEMPGPTRWRGQLITHALMANKMSRQTLDLRVREVLKLVSHVAKVGVSENAPEGSRDIPETAELLRRIASESIVLLKNENQVLPFEKLQTVSQHLNAEWLPSTLIDSYFLIGRGYWTKCKGRNILWRRFSNSPSVLCYYAI